MHFLPSNSLRALLQDSENCCFCDSRDGKSHGIENVVSRSDPDGKKTWWQAESGEGPCVPLCAGLGSGQGLAAEQPLWLQVLRMSPSSWT